MKLSRRTFLASSGVVAGSLISTKAIASPVAPVPEKWDESHDVVVIGSGFAGLAAAIEASKAGADVVVLEKMPNPGGNSIINGGIMAATGSPQQKAANIEDSPELFVEDVLKAGDHLNDRKKVEFVASKMLDNYNWTVDELGVDWNPNITQDGGHSVPRSVMTSNGSGSGIVQKELEKLASYGIKPRTRVFVEKLIRDPETGRMLGVLVREGYRFPDENSGKEKFIEAKKGVVAAWGGFGADGAYRSIHDPKLVPSLPSTNQPGATGELWKEAANDGVSMVQVDWIQSFPANNVKEKGMGYTWPFALVSAAKRGLWVGSDGNRFINEMGNRKVRADAINLLHEKGLKAYAINNQAGVEDLNNLRPGMLDKAVEAGLIEKYDTLEDLAKATNIALDALKESIQQINDFPKPGIDSLGRDYDTNYLPLVEGPWYVMEITPKVHHTMGGIQTTTEGQAIDVLTGKPIPGFYAAGEAAAGMHGAVRLGTNAILDSLVMGRSVGGLAAKDGS